MRRWAARRLPAGLLGCAVLVVLPTASWSRVTEDRGTVRATVQGDSLWEIAGAATAGSGVDRNQAMVAILRANPRAFVGGNLHRIEKGVSLVVPSLAEIRAEDPRQAAALVAQHRAAAANRVLAPMPLYPVGPGAALAPVSAAAVPAPSPDPTRPPASASLASSSPQGDAATPSVQWWPAVVLLALAAAAVALFRRRRGSNPFDDETAAVEHASRLFADSRLDLESQLEVQPPADSEPLYSTLDEPVDAAPPVPAQQVTQHPASVLVLRNGRGPMPADLEPAVGGDALALALTVAHAYADMGRPEAARRWLRAIDARGAAAFDPGNRPQA